MDRSFLSDAAVIAASRKFVCVRLTTYEDKTEGELLKSFRVTRSGDLENTVFTILSPDGKRQLVRASRSARQAFDDAKRMAETMNRLAAESASRDAGIQPPLPTVRNVRLALDVAASDNQPLVVLSSVNAVTRLALEERVGKLAWSEPFLGQFVYVTAAGSGELSAIDGVKPGSRVLVVQPDQFGQKGRVLAQVTASAGDEELTKCLKDGLGQYQRAEKTFQNHVREGQRKGIFWETVIPVTDPMERQARDRGRGRGGE
jgi:hypothetical protein